MSAFVFIYANYRFYHVAGRFEEKCFIGYEIKLISHMYSRVSVYWGLLVVKIFECHLHILLLVNCWTNTQVISPPLFMVKREIKPYVL